MSRTKVANEKVATGLNFSRALGIFQSIIYSRGECEQLILHNSQFNRTTHFSTEFALIIIFSFFPLTSGRAILHRGKGLQHGLRCCAAQRKECATSGRVFQSKCPLLQTPRCQILFISAERLVASLNRPFVRITNSCLRNMFNVLYMSPSLSPDIRKRAHSLVKSTLSFYRVFIFLKQIKQDDFLIR